MAREYYCLVAGLRDYGFDAETKGFDAIAIRSDIREQLSEKDFQYLDILYTYYDIENIVNLRAGRSQHNSLGNFSREELTEEVATPVQLPAYLARVLAAYRDPEGGDFEDIDTAQALERSLFTAYYKECARSSCKFIALWSEFDMNLRNLCAAYNARKAGIEIFKVVVGDNFIAHALKRSSAADFGLKGEVEYIDQVMTAITNDQNLVDKERTLDLLRWNFAEDMVMFDYFNVNKILSYLVQINLIHRWEVLDPQTGRAMFERLINSLSSKEMIEKAEKEK